MILIVIVLCGSAFAQEYPVTQVSIDGLARDWSDYPTLLVDRQGDARNGGFDLKSVRAFTNDQYLYLMIEAHGEIGEYVQVDLDIDVNSDGRRDYMATFRPRTTRRDFGDFTGSRPVWGSMRGGEAAESEVVELKMPLELIKSVTTFDLILVRVMNGTCCEEEWRCTDEMGPVPVPHSEEKEPSFGSRFAAWLTTAPTRPASRPFVINATDEGLEGDRGLFINPAETKAYIVAEFSGMLSLVNIDSGSPRFGKVTPIASDLFVPTNLDVDESKMTAYVTREMGPSRGQNAITAVNLSTGASPLVTNKLGQVTNIELSSDGRTAYVVSMSQGELDRVVLSTGTATRLARGMVDPKEPFALVINRSETIAYVATTPASSGDYPPGDLLRVDLRTGAKTTVARGAIQGGSGITLTANEEQVLVTEFGHEGGCDGAISAINVDPQSPKYGKKVVLLSGLCGPHDLRLNKLETVLFFVEVDGCRFSAVRVCLDQVLYP